MACIYRIENIVNNKKYIGQTKRTFRDRKNQHIYYLNRNIHQNQHLQNAWNKYGKDNFRFSTIERCNISSLDEKEVFWINHYNTTELGYNKEAGGNLNKIISKETREKHSRIQTGENNSRTNLTNETVIKIKQELIKGNAMKEISLKYEVSYDVVKAIRQCRTFCDIGEEYNDSLLKLIKPRNIIGIDVVRKIKLMKKKGVSSEKIAEELNVSQWTVRKIIKENPQCFKRAKRKDSYLTYEDKKQVAQMYKKGMFQKDIAKHFSVSQKIISLALKEIRIDTGYNPLKGKRTFIEKKIAEGVSLRKIASELGVSHTAIRNYLSKGGE